MVTTDDVKKLREQTGISVMQCKKALEESEGDMEKALVILRKQGASVASKKSDRDLGAGRGPDRALQGIQERRRVHLAVPRA